MAGGWARDGAVQDQIDATVQDAVERARHNLQGGTGTPECVECGAEIPPARRQAMPSATRCIACQSEMDAADKVFSGYNRSGSKDSQLR